MIDLICLRGLCEPNNIMVSGVLESECNRLWRHDIRTDIFKDRVAFPAALAFDSVDIDVL